MFEQTFVAPGRSRREQTILLALGLQTLLMMALLIAPLTRIEPIQVGKRLSILPPVIIAEQPPIQQTAAATALPTMTRRVLDFLTAPVYNIPHVGPLVPEDAPALQAYGPSSPNSAVIVGLNVASMPGPPVTQPVPPARPKPETPGPPVRISSGTSAAHLEFGPKPAYPRLAITTRTEGTVRLQAIISRDGRIENLHVLSGHPLLIAAAMDAVRQWRYRPVLLNGDPVEVITEIDVNFSLNK